MNKIALAMIASFFLLLAPASTAVEESATFSVGDKWALGHEFDIMEEFSSATEELLAELDAEIENNSTGEYDDLMGYNINENEGVIGIYYTGEVIDDLDGSIHIKSEESFYIHTAIDTTITGIGFEEGNFSDVEEKCVYNEENDDEDCTYTQSDGSEMPTKEFTMAIGGNFHYVTKVITETWWTQDDYHMEKMDLTLSMGMSGGMNLNNVPNETMEPKQKDVDWDDDGHPDDTQDDCEHDHEKNEDTCNYEYVNTAMETVELAASAELSYHFLFEFTEPMNVLDLPLEKDEYWQGETGLTISGDMAGMIDVEKPVLSICPDLDCDQLPEMQELYEALTTGIQELHENETFSITVDRDSDGQPDVIEKWDDIFPMYVPETWMNDIFQTIIEAVSCEDDESAQEGEDCDETAEKELERLDLRIENNRFAFGPYTLQDPESGDTIPIPYAFETKDEKFGRAADETVYTGFQVLPADRCSEKNPDREEEECDREDEDCNPDEEDCDEEDRDEEDPFSPNDGGGDSRSDHDEDCNPDEEDCAADRDCAEEEKPDPFCEAEMNYFHDSQTGQLTFMEMDMPYLKDEGYSAILAPAKDAEEVKEMEDKVEANADPEEPEKNDVLTEPPIEEDESLLERLPGFGVMATVGCLMLAGRRFRS